MKRAAKSDIDKLKEKRTKNRESSCRREQDPGRSKTEDRSSSKSFTMKTTDTSTSEFYIFNVDILNSDEEVRQRDGYSKAIPQKNGDGTLIFSDAKEFCPNMTPKEVLQAGSFGGTYFRPIKSSVTGLKYDKMWSELPQNWLEGLDVSKMVCSSTYNEKVNTYKVKSGGDLEMWESSGWIAKIDPYGWFMWYCRFYLGRRSEDDDRQISRWKNCAGPKGRWKNNLIGKIARAGANFENIAISPVVRQTLQHWAYRLTEKDYVKGKKRVKM
eukprot:gene816-112_t